VELRVLSPVDGAARTELLYAAALGALNADGLCRRVVYAAPSGDVAAMATAIAASFRFVVDVEVAGEDLSLLVLEPDWVTGVDMDLGRAPDN
jgi:hypothetical protein